MKNKNINYTNPIPSSSNINNPPPPLSALHKPDIEKGTYKKSNNSSLFSFDVYTTIPEFFECQSLWIF